MGKLLKENRNTKKMMWKIRGVEWNRICRTRAPPLHLTALGSRARLGLELGTRGARGGHQLDRVAVPAPVSNTLDLAFSGLNP